MKFKLNLILVIAVTAFCVPTYSQAQEVLIKAGKILDVKTGKILNNKILIINDGIISQITTKLPKTSQDALIIDLSDKFVLPGLMDMHTHIVRNLSKSFYDGYYQSPHRATIGGVVNAKKTLLAGFTAIRNVGASDFQDVAIRNAINAGEVPGPRMAVLGVSLGITAGHCDSNALNHSFKEQSGGVFSKGTEIGQRQYTQEEMNAIVDEAHTHGRTVAAHAHGTEGIAFAIRAGVDSIEHASFLDKNTIALAKEHDTVLSMDIYNTEYTLAEGKKNGIVYKHPSK